MTKNNYKNDTKNIIAGKKKKLSNGFVNSPVYKGSTVLFKSVEDMQSKMKKKNSQTLFYGRFGSPATFEFENAVADIDDAYSAVATASGTAAIVASLLAVLKTAPAPVIIAHPNKAASDKSILLSIFLSVFSSF